MNEMMRSALPPLVALDEALTKRRNNKIDTYFPDTGPLCRDNYPRHMKFFELGKTHRERLFLASNRCISLYTPIETGSSTRLSRELLGETTFDVRSWADGQRRSAPASAIFLKGLEPMFRTYLDNGQFFDCTRKHLVLTIGGWISFEQLVRGASGLRCRRTFQGSLANYVAGGRPCDAQPLAPSEIVRESLPSQAGAQTRSLDDSPMDEAAQTRTHTRAYQDYDRPSILDEALQIEALCELFPDPANQIDVVWNSSLRRELSRLALEYAPSPKGSSCETRLFSSDAFSRIEYLAVDNTQTVVRGSRLSLEQYQSALSHAHAIQEFLEAKSHTQMFVPWAHAPLVGNIKIQAIVPLGVQPVIDFSVPQTACYEIGGVVHHNSGKTIAGSIECSFHATGLYPKWWPGKRFDTPTLIWACNQSSTKTRDINQLELLGKTGEHGTGMVPAAYLLNTKPKPSVPDGIEIAYVRHVSGGKSVIKFLSYEQGRKNFQGDAVHVIWLDEEVPADIYTECVLRTMTTGGVVMCTYTPILGMTEVTMGFLPQGRLPSEAEMEVGFGFVDNK